MKMASEVEAESRRRDLTKWLTAGVAVATAISGIFQFYYKEIFAPAMVPVNIALDLEISPLKAAADDKDIIPALMKITLSNKGNKSVYLKNPIWMAYGIYRNDGQFGSAGTFTIPRLPKPEALQQRCGPESLESKDGLEEAFVKCWNRKLAPMERIGKRLDPRIFTDRLDLLPEGDALPSKPSHHNHSLPPTRELIGTGPIGKVDELKPGQEVRSQVLIPVSKALKYDYLEAVVSVPTVSGVPEEMAGKIASVSFINLQEPSNQKLYQRLRGFCVTTAKRPSLVDDLQAFRLSGRDALNGATTTKARPTQCYADDSIPEGTYWQRMEKWSRSFLPPNELSQYGAQFYDVTYEVPLHTPQEAPEN